MVKNFENIVFYNRRPVDRRKVEEKRFFRRFRENNEYLALYPDRRVKERRQNTENMLKANLQKNGVNV